MSVLHNLISNKELKERMLIDTEPRITISFYKYFYINSPKKFRDILYISLIKCRVLGRIYIAHEGINAQISVPKMLFNELKKIINYFSPELKNIRMNIALDDNGKSFWVLRIKVRKQIVVDGIDDNSFDVNNVGQYLNATELNHILDDPESLLIDMRNHYEYEIGHFEKSIKIPANTFREQMRIIVNVMKDNKDKKIVMYCTGGIRCEKATAWMKHNGFKNVYHIEGGIIGYIHQAKKLGLKIRFKGKNFVFDERMSERITDDIISSCHQCGKPCDHYINCINNICHVLFIQCIQCSKKYQNCCSSRCMEELTLSPEEKKLVNIIRRNNYFNKSYSALNLIDN